MSKILFHINSMGKGGAERVISILSRCFAQDGNDVAVATLWTAEEEYPLDERVRRIHVGLTPEEEKKGRIYKALVRMLRYRQSILKEKPDIVISFCANANFRSAYSLIGTKIPLLVSVRNDPRTDYAPYPKKCRFMTKKAVGCVFQTPDAKKFFDEELQKKSRIIWNPLDEKYLSNQESQAKQRDKTIVTVGRITRQKNQILLLRAFSKICDEFPEYQLQIYGEAGSDGVKEELEAFCMEHKIADRVRFMGASSTLEKDIKNAGLFVLPSDYEGMPNALIEAMAMGLPCVATDCPCGGSALLIDQYGGILVPTGAEEELAEAMRRVLSDTELANRIGLQARGVVNSVNPQKIYQEWKDYVETLIR